MIEDRLAGAAEALLFASGDAIDLEDIAAALGSDRRGARRVLKGLEDRYLIENRGIKIIELDGAFQMCTNPDFFEYIERLGKTPKKRPLSQAVMETLAIIAYRQPVTKHDIEDIRGVNADHAVNKLMEYGLAAELGRAETPGRPVLFGTTEEFLRRFGIASVNELPTLPAFSGAEPDGAADG